MPGTLSLFSFSACVLLSVAAWAPGGAEPLRPDELLLVYKAGDPSSRKLAEYYASRRSVPANRLCALSIKSNKDQISSADFERLIRKPIRDYLEQKRLRKRVRCLVTFYGVPIRVGKQPTTPEQTLLLENWRKQFISALGELERAVQELDAMGADTRPATSPGMPTEKDYHPLVKRYAAARVKAFERISKVSDADMAKALKQGLFEIIKKVEGVARLVTNLEPTAAEGESAMAEQLERLREATRKADARIKDLLERSPEDRVEAHVLAREFHGLLGLLTVLRSGIDDVRQDETQAAVDSELMLLWWDDYRKYRWVVNTLNWRHRTNAATRQQLPLAYWDLPVLMVSRVDAPTPEIARRMIDHAIQAERKGLTGTVYVDARGLKRSAGHGSYDQSLRDLAHMLWDHSDLRVRLDNRPSLFGPDRCPDTMLYCGWYSPRKYVQAFTFVPGAVGYHIASFEAVSLRIPGQQGWCARMLEDGITATIGPVAEPYVQSVPPPHDFFGLLLTGRFTLAECFAYTVTFNSWMQMLLGDPLYRPFAKRPILSVEQVFRPDQIPAEFEVCWGQDTSSAGPVLGAWRMVDGPPAPDRQGSGGGGQGGLGCRAWAIP